MAISYCSQGDLEIAVGGADVLRKLSDPTRLGQPAANIITDYLETGATRVRAAIEVKHDPETIANLSQNSLRLLKDLNAALSARTAYIKGGQGVAMPEWVDDAAKRADHDLDLIIDGKLRLGRVAGDTAAAINGPVQIVDPDPLNDGGRDSHGAPQGRTTISGLRSGGFR